MNRARPVNLNLMTIRFPIPAIVSILHRISGAILFLFIPVIIWTLDLSLTQDGFDALHDWSSSVFLKLVIWGVLAAFLYHLTAGIRHLLSDIHIGSTLRGGRLSAQLTFIISIILIILAGIWLW
ncbi:MAG TPA: succinate dehydrogenase, cytochrome b556 subunit [Gammaproteobacteria bacterium]|nr:succinate dehydrogenase, cytochrome b556 subunit [Gammaproteobacteria bacterium]